MSSTSNPTVTICDPDGTPAEVSNNGLKVDVGDNIELTVGDVVKAEQDTPEELKVLVHGHSDGGVYYPLQCNTDGKLTLDPASSINMSGLVLSDTELLSPALLADNTANPTITQISSYPMVYDGSTWDRMRGTSADGLLVNLGTNNEVLLESGSTTIVSEIEEDVNLGTVPDLNIATIPDVTSDDPNTLMVGVFGNTETNGTGSWKSPTVSPTGQFAVANTNDADDMRVGIWGNTEIDGSGTYRIPEVSSLGGLHVSVENPNLGVRGDVADNDPVPDYPVTIGAKVFGNDWAGADTIHAGDSASLITDLSRSLWVSEKPAQTWSEDGPFTLDGTQESLSDLMGSVKTALKEIIIQASIDNTGYVSVVTDSAATLGDGIRLDAGDLLTLRISDNRPIAVIGSDATQKINLMTL